MEKKLPGALDEIIKSFATDKPLRLMFQDEARFGRISDTRYCWARRPVRPMVKAMLTYQYTYAYGAVCPMDGKFDSLVLPHVNTECMQLFITEIGSRYPQENIVMVVDGAGWHKSTTFVLPENLQLHFLPPYSPQLNPQEHIWDELREKYFHNQAFDSMDALEVQLIKGLQHLEQSPEVVKSIAGWEWILNCVSNANWNNVHNKGYIAMVIENGGEFFVRGKYGPLGRLNQKKDFPVKPSLSDANNSDQNIISSKIAKGYVLTGGNAQVPSGAFAKPNPVSATQTPKSVSQPPKPEKSPAAMLREAFKKMDVSLAIYEPPEVGQAVFDEL